MGLHQKITDRTTSEPCDCGADDDHPVLAEDGSLAHLLAAASGDPDEFDRVEDERSAEPEGITSLESVEGDSEA